MLNKLAAEQSALPPAGLRTYVVFTAGGARLGIPVGRVGGVVPMKELTPIRHAPAYLRGMVDVSNQKVPVVDLAVKFGLPPEQIKPHTCIIFVQVLSADQPVLVGLVTPEVPEVIKINPEQIKPAPIGSQMRACSLGEVEIEGTIRTMLDLDRTIDIADLFPANNFVN